MTIVNNGATSATLALSPLAGASPSLFAMDPLSPDTLAVGASVSFEVRFAPLQAGPASRAGERLLSRTFGVRGLRRADG